MRIEGPEQLNEFARSFTAQLAPGPRARLVALSGDLGAGKTTFVQALAAALGVTETVSSPTFVIQKRYALSGSPWTVLIHIDAYRLHGAEELQRLGWQEDVADPGHLILLEWPERVPELIVEDAIRIHFEIDGQGRIITVNGLEDAIEGAGGTARAIR